MNYSSIGKLLWIITPKKPRAWLGSIYKQQRFLNYLKQAFGDRIRHQLRGPFPPPELIETEALMHKENVSSFLAQKRYFGSGYIDARHFLTTAERYGLDCVIDNLTSAPQR